MAHHKDLTISVGASGPDDLEIVVSVEEIPDHGEAEVSTDSWEFTVPKAVWDEFTTQLAPGFTHTVSIHHHEEG